MEKLRRVSKRWYATASSPLNLQVDSSEHGLGHDIDRFNRLKNAGVDMRFL